ncbi:MAG: Na+/H+ antiporter subunit E [Betaproteobacteria bacterium]|nr:Na+/H+ antiporter subunit E [Betaproteobacteria bacterium]
MRWQRRHVLVFSLFVFWLLLAGDFSAGNLVLGAVLALGIERYARSFNPAPMRRVRLGGVPHLVAIVLWDVVVANVQVARRSLGPLAGLQTCWVVVPLDLTDRTAIALLGAIITTTPGTVTASLSPDQSHFLVHGLVVEDAQRLVRSIKLRYERPLKEIFEC